MQARTPSLILSCIVAVTGSTYRAYSAAPTAPVIGRTTILAVSGDLAPEDAGVFDRFSDAILKDDGQVVFRGCLSGGNPCSQNSVFRVDGASIIEIARENSQVPGSSDTFSEIDSFTLNDVGQIILDVHVTGVGGVRKGAIYRTDGTSFVQIVRAGHLRRSDCEQEDTRRGGGTLDAED